jgi:hypothetical protein
MAADPRSAVAIVTAVLARDITLGRQLADEHEDPAGLALLVACMAAACAPVVARALGHPSAEAWLRDRALGLAQAIDEKGGTCRS